jgi:hypothetical protein
MRPVRLILVVASIAAVMLLVALVLAFNASFQTWMVRRSLAAHPEWGLSIERVDVGLSGFTLANLRLAQSGAVLSVPRLEADLPIFTALRAEKLSIARLEAKGWTLAVAPAAPAASPTRGLVNAAQPAGASPGATSPFAGVFDYLRLPFDLAAERVRLEGEVVLPEEKGRVTVAIVGGGLRAQHEGKLDLLARAALADRKVSSIEVRGTLVAAMDTARTFSQFAFKMGATAHGAQFPTGVQLMAGITAARAATGETYLATLTTEERQLLTLKADLPRAASRLDGTWKIDLRDTDLAPFVLGHPLPAFTLAAEGRFDGTPSFSAFHVAGRMSASASRLHVLRPELSEVGPVKLAAEFDVAQRGELTSVHTLEVLVSGTQPVLAARAVQSFDFNATAREFLGSDPGRDLFDVVLHDVPLAWFKPLLGDVEISGGNLRGHLGAVPRAEGLSAVSRAPLSIARASIRRAGKALVRDVDVSFDVSADYAPQGWQAEIARFSARSAEQSILTLDVKAGQLAGPNQPLKATGKATADLAALSAQPFARDVARPVAGTGNVEFAASVGEKTALQAKLDLRRLAAPGVDQPLELPAVGIDLRADLEANGAVAFHLPVTLERGGRNSDLTLTGTVGAATDGTRKIEAQATSANLVLEDAKVLATMLPSQAGGTAEAARPTGAPWSGVNGILTLQLKKLVYSQSFEVSNVIGRVRLDSGNVKLETVQAGLGAGGRVAMSGNLSFDPAAAKRFGLEAEVNLREFDPSTLLRGSGSQPAILEGRFDIGSKLNSRAEKLEELLLSAGGEFHVVSRSGVFRGLPVNVGSAADSTSVLASIIASASSMLGGLTGRRESSDIANRSQALSELTKGLSAIVYDQLSFVATRDDNLNTTLRDFSLIAPELRVTGGGTAMPRPGGNLADNSVALEFTLKAQGRHGELLKYLGVLDPMTDELGYAACVVPIRVSGTLGNLDATESSRRLASLAVEKAGFIDKAADWLTKPRASK